MTRLVAVMIVAGAVAVSAQATRPQGAPPPPPQTKQGTMPDKAAIEKTLAETEQKINDAFVKNDAATFKTMVATEAWSVDANGVMPAAELEKMLKPGAAKVTDTKLTGFKVLWVDASTAVLTYTWEGKGTFMDQPVTSPTYAATVYTKRGDKWLAVFHQETAAAPKPPKK
jgi:hypothetical protein